MLAAVGLVASAAVFAATAAPPDSLAPIPTRVLSGAGPTFAIVAFDSASASWGVACVSAEIAIGARAADASAEAGAVLSLGTGSGARRLALTALAAGARPDSALLLLTPASADPEARLSLIVGRNGQVVARAGKRLEGSSGVRLRRHVGVAGFGLHEEGTLDAMALAFEGAPGEVGARLIAALEAGERADGDPFAVRGREASAALLVVRRGADPGSGSDRLSDLRVDWNQDPVGTLGRLYAQHASTFLPAAYVRFGDEARRRGDETGARREYAAAEGAFRAAVARAPKDADALNELAWFLATRGGDPGEALRFAEAAVTARRDDPNLLDTLAEAAYRAGDLERAIDAAERAARLARGNTRYAERLRAFRAAKAALAPSSR